MELDNIDRKILTVLQRNNRIANVELAEEVGLSPPACHKRVKRLRDENIIVGDVSLLNPELTGNKLTLLVSVEMERDRKEIYDAFKRVINRSSEVKHCYQITGNYDFVMVVVVPDMQAFEEFVDRVLHTDANIRKFQTSVSLRTVKTTTEIPLN
ncbi:Lrp/AsnC family transcriptional regulator [Marinomonas mediterranea]|jgi:transcriptional regulator, AsnC family|uniref:Transcriptional regulator, AsnC family n=1 Tax=Marinomonas mediterranea (strain ATCC 700492 / JCM 21426 / NBRC 103028 / MMB-1) TaxID=717774 RepID=F2K3T3_MARM1|nr:Lrp/AsnC family transcriptional regulator [Marinomonas mediterranea]ADZ90182.1 transcriptional regulator, AsnC family [Marinomonas mediterranea MMB-1]WCN08243.1 AsnC family transcriptional regulator [Marinomonas mediterranea]WCN16381.1 AsnC family transcriptional regulator [Marinomonas mediterranea MMB-1]